MGGCTAAIPSVAAVESSAEPLDLKMIIPVGTAAIPSVAAVESSAEALGVEPSIAPDDHRLLSAATDGSRSCDGGRFSTGDSVELAASYAAQCPAQ